MTRIVIGIDPGLRATGVAFLELYSRKLVSAWLCCSSSIDDGLPAWLAMARQIPHEINMELNHLAATNGDDFIIDAVAVERQAIRGEFGGTDAKGKRRFSMATPNPGQILDLAYVTGMVLFELSKRVNRRFAPYPQSWNGNKKKPVSNGKVWRRLTPEERKRIRDAQFIKYDEHGGAHFESRGNNVIDAIGIATWCTLQTRVVENRTPPEAEAE